jgi:hypothetical protein
MCATTDYKSLHKQQSETQGNSYAMPKQVNEFDHQLW